MRYTRKRVLVLVIVFVVWCIFFFVGTRYLRLTPLAHTIAGDIISGLILPGALIAELLNPWALLHGNNLSFIFLVCLVFIGSPGIYLLIAHLIMRHIERRAQNK